MFSILFIFDNWRKDISINIFRTFKKHLTSQSPDLLSFQTTLFRRVSQFIIKVSQAWVPEVGHCDVTSFTLRSSTSCNCVNEYLSISCGEFHDTNSIGRFLWLRSRAPYKPWRCAPNLASLNGGAIGGFFSSWSVCVGECRRFLASL